MAEFQRMFKIRTRLHISTTIEARIDYSTPNWITRKLDLRCGLQLEFRRDVPRLPPLVDFNPVSLVQPVVTALSDFRSVLLPRSKTLFTLQALL